MQVSRMNIDSNSRNFGHTTPWTDSPYDKKKQVVVGLTTAAGVLSSMAILAKHEGYSLAPRKIFKNFNKSWFKNTEFCDEKPVIVIGAGSCAGGLAGGLLIDKDKENRKAKLRETLLQIVNISLPIIFTIQAGNLGEIIGKKYLEKGLKETLRTKLSKATGAIAGLFAGVFCANIIANKINEKIFKQGKGRPVQASDFSAHWDDFVVAAKQINENQFTDFLSRLIPFALMIAGNEIGNTTVENADS